MKEINRLVGIGVLKRQSSSQWASPTFIIKKKKVKINECVEFVKINCIVNLGVIVVDSGCEKQCTMQQRRSRDIKVDLPGSKNNAPLWSFERPKESFVSRKRSQPS